MGEQKFGIEHRPCQYIAHAIKEVYALGVQMGIVYPCVFNLFEQGAMLKAVCGQKKGLLVIGGENEQRHGTDKIENASSA